MIEKRLFEMQDEKYGEFQAKLMPTVSREKIIGIRTPCLRNFAKEIKEKDEARNFLKKLPHRYYEEDNLHAFLIEYIKDYDECIIRLNEFLPYVDNWATCDCMNPKILKKYPDQLLKQIDIWLDSDKTYTVRYGIKMLMSHYLDENFNVEYLERVALINSEEYYVKMMKAWYFATALAKQYDDAVVYLKEKRLPIWEHNKTIQKATESYRISDKYKTELRKLRIKE